jgi:hypothetical protein
MVGGVFCDLKKAFDSVDHNILLLKIHFYGVSGKFYNLIESYLCNRYQRVLIPNIERCHVNYSDWTLVDRGVPQGSILGPLLFLCYIDDLPRIFENNVKPVLFADDTSLIINSHSLLQYKK